MSTDAIIDLALLEIHVAKIGLCAKDCGYRVAKLASCTCDDDVRARAATFERNHNKNQPMIDEQPIIRAAVSNFWNFCHHSRTSLLLR